MRTHFVRQIYIQCLITNTDTCIRYEIKKKITESYTHKRIENEKLFPSSAYAPNRIKMGLPLAEPTRIEWCFTAVLFNPVLFSYLKKNTMSETNH